MSSQTEVRPDRLVREPLVLREEGSGTRALAMETLGSLTERLNVVLEMNSTEAIKRAVQAGLGVTIISQSIIKAELERGEIAALRIEGCTMRRDFSLAYLRNRPQSPAARAFIAFVTEGHPHA